MTAELLQLVLTGPKFHSTPHSDTVGDGVNGIAVECRPSADCAVAPRDSQHPLKIYWDYLSFLFRRIETPGEQEMMELGYRDHLQVG